MQIQWNLWQGTLWDRDDLSTKDTCFNLMLYFSVLFDFQDKDNLSTRDKIVGLIVSLTDVATPRPSWFLTYRGGCHCRLAFSSAWPSCCGHRCVAPRAQRRERSRPGWTSHTPSGGSLSSYTGPASPLWSEHIHTADVETIYSGTSELGTLWGQQFCISIGLKHMSFVERSSFSQWVPYRRFHCS